MRLFVVAALLVGCSINHRSGDYTCTKQTDCSTGRTCQGGFCVTDVTNPDGPAMKLDGMGSGSNNCPAGCSSCDVAQHTCDINCESSRCDGPVACPTGYRCTIECNQQNSCTHGVNCQNALSCAITCSGQSSCQNVQCGPGPCGIGCTGSDSCQDVNCGNSCSCSVTCTNATSCQQNVTCTSPACKIGLGCTAGPAFCHSC